MKAPRNSDLIAVKVFAQNLAGTCSALFWLENVNQHGGHEHTIENLRSSAVFDFEAIAEKFGMKLVPIEAGEEEADG